MGGMKVKVDEYFVLYSIKYLRPSLKRPTLASVIGSHLVVLFEGVLLGRVDWDIEKSILRYTSGVRCFRREDNNDLMRM